MEQLHPTGASGRVAVVLDTVAGELALKRRHDGGGQHGGPVSPALPASHHDVVRGEVEVLDPQPGALDEAETSAVEENGHEPRRAAERQKDGPHLVAVPDPDRVTDGVRKPGISSRHSGPLAGAGCPGHGAAQPRRVGCRGRHRTASIDPDVSRIQRRRARNLVSILGRGRRASLSRISLTPRRAAA
jgi:hypothetical protein